MLISESDKIDIDQIIYEFIQYVNQESPDISTDTDVVRVKVIKPDPNG